MPAFGETNYILDKLRWIRAEQIWPNGRRGTIVARDIFGGLHH